MMAWAARTGGLVALVAVWALVFAPGGDTAGRQVESVRSIEQLTVGVLAPTLGVDGAWRADRSRPDLPEAPPTATEPGMVALAAEVTLAIGAGARAPLLRRASPVFAPSPAGAMAWRRRGPPVHVFA